MTTTAQRYGYLTCSGNKERVCLLCEAQYLARNPVERNAFCSSCFSKTRKHELHLITVNLTRAKKAGTPATLTIKQWLNILEHFNWKCAYCFGPYEVVEHIKSINAGGGTTNLNCVPSCIPCNARKDRGAISNAVPIDAIERAKQELHLLTIEN